MNLVSKEDIHNSGFLEVGKADGVMVNDNNEIVAVINGYARRVTYQHTNTVTGETKCVVQLLAILNFCMN